jgi:tetratricopeptide (TPR) repeat protein
MNYQKLTIIFTSTLCIITILGFAFIQWQIDGIRPSKSRMEEKLIYIPSAKFVKTASLGFHAILADLMWARTTVYFGEHSRTDKDYKWLYHLLDVVTTLDPENLLAYRFGGNLLALEKRDIEASIAILKKGIKNNPDEDWMLYFLLGFDYFFFLNDYVSAAEYLEKATKIPGHPAYLPKLVARMYAKSNKIDTAIQFLEGMYNQYKEPDVKASIAERLKILVAKKQAYSLKPYVEKYKELYGKYPEKPEELLQTGLIKQLNIFPGGQYVIDPNTGNTDWISKSSPNWP